MKIRYSVCLAVLFFSLTVCGCTKKNSVTYTPDSDLTGLTIGVKEGTTGHNIASSIKDSRIRTFANGSEAVLALKNFAVDAVIFDEIPSKELARYNNDIEIIYMNSFPVEEYGIGVSKENKELLSSVNKILSKMKQNGQFDRLEKIYFTEEETPSPYVPQIIPDAPSIRVGTDRSFAPFEYIQNNELYGFDIELVKQIALELNRNLEIINMNFDGLIPSLYSERIDLIAAGMTITEKRKEMINFSDPYFTSRQVLVVRK